jgi:nucleoside-diphosphate-sugar epimerase
MGDTDLNELRLRCSIDETRYPNTSNPYGINGYVEGKLQSEKLFLDAARASGGRWDALITNPGDNIGPVLSKGHVTARKAFTPWHCIIAQIVAEGIISQSFAYRPWWTVDVRDTAEVHVLLLESTTAGSNPSCDSSNRYFVCSTDAIDVERIGATISKSMPHIDFDMSDLSMSDSEFGRGILIELGITETEARSIWQGCKLQNRRICETVGIIFRPLEESLRDCVQSLITVAGVSPRLNGRAKRRLADSFTDRYG